MADVYCGHCGEPWETWSVCNEFTDTERAEFKTGKACPSCDGQGNQSADDRARGMRILAGLGIDDIDDLAADLGVIS